MRAAMTEIAAFGGLLIVHAEDPGQLTEPIGPGYAEFLASRPAGSEGAAVARVARLAPETGCRAHIVHLSDAGSLPLLAERRGGGRPDQRRDLPALPDAVGRARCRRAAPSSSAARRSAARATASGCGRALADGRDRLRRLRPLAVRARAEEGRLRHRLGRDLLAPARPAGHLDRRARPRARAGATSSAGWRPAPPELAGLTGKGRIEVGADADLVAFAADAVLRRRPRRAAPAAPRHAVRRTRADRRGRDRLAARRAVGDRAARTPAEEAPMSFTAPARPRPAHARRLGHGGQRRVVRGEGEPHQPAGGRRSSRTPSGPRARSTTAGRPGGAASPATTGRSSGSACPGVIRGVVVDTAWFKGNYPPYASVEACAAEGYPSAAELDRLDRDRAEEPAEGRRGARVRGRRRPPLHPRAAQHLPRRRRRPAAGARRGRPGPAAAHAA